MTRHESKMIVRLHESVLERLSRSGDSHGLVIGQVSAEAFEVLWVARSGESILEHAGHVTRMLPGGTFVMGAFANAPERVETAAGALRAVLSKNEYAHGVPTDTEDTLILIHNGKQLNCFTKRHTSSLTPIKHLLAPNSSQWNRLDCYCHFDDVYCDARPSSLSVRERFGHVLESARVSLDKALLFIDGTLRRDDDVTRFPSERSDPPQVTILLADERLALGDAVEYMECEGTTHFSGVVASRVYLNPSATLGDAVRAIRQDILRSLAARFTMHCDALISDSLLPEEKVCFNEPPRRVSIRMPHLADGNIFFSDYLFPGESPDEALSSVKEMLDVDITEDDVISDIETPADTSELDAIEKHPSNEELTATPHDANKVIYLLMIGIAVLVAAIAITVQLVLR